MKTLKNLEAVFTVAVAIACAASYASFVQAPATADRAAQASGTMHVVTVTAKRMTAEEKQLSLLEERQAVQSSRVATASL